MDEKKILDAEKISLSTKKYAESLIKKDMLLIDIAEKIEAKIIELGGKPAFPVNLSIDNIAAHFTPSFDDKNVAHGLLKIDFGVHVDGWIIDRAFSLDLENNEENKKLIEASNQALNNALKIIKKGISTNEIGQIISNAIEFYNFSPVLNLSGHSMNQYELHAGISIPNFNDGKNKKINSGLYAIEPFATNGSGRIREGRPSGIYELKNPRNVRSPIAREILEFIKEEYKTLPFCSRWIIKKFGTKSLIGLKQLEENGNLHQFPQLVEISNSKVSQAEETVLIQ